MTGWLNLWSAVLLLTLAMFACLAVAVSIGGLLDIRKMIRELRRQHAQADRSDSSPTEPPR